MISWLHDECSSKFDDRPPQVPGPMGMGGWFSGHQWGHGDFSQKFMVIYPLVNETLTVCELERSSMLLRTVNQLFSMAMFNIYVKLPESNQQKLGFHGVSPAFHGHQWKPWDITKQEHLIWLMIGENHETLPLWRFQFIVFLMRYKWEHNLTKLSWGKDMEV